MIELRSDNAAGVVPEVLDAIVAANEGSALAYGGDDVTSELTDLVRDVFAHDGLAVFPVTSGTAANALGLSAMTPPWGAVWCHDTAHIVANEGGATSALSGGAVMTGVGGTDGRIDADELANRLGAVRWGDNHQSQPAVLSLTQPTDIGTIYQPAHIERLAGIAADHNLLVHLDGARLANSIAALGCEPAAVTTAAGVQTFSLGATKNGAMSAEAIVTSDQRVAAELTYRTKRAGHVSSKMRFQSAQLVAYLSDRRWLRHAEHANACMKRLVENIERLDLAERFVLEHPVEVNMAFYRCSVEDAQLLNDAGLAFYTMDGRARMVTSWATTFDEVDEAAAIIGATLGS